jgi:hypothetical protein
MKQIAGNLASRWTDFLTTDGEKPSRNRDGEFVDTFGSRAELLEAWERGWACLLTALKSLMPEDLGKTVMIRGEPHSVPLALERSLGHTCYHVGQIVQVARIHAGKKWDTLTIPRGGSDEFNKANWGQTRQIALVDGVAYLPNQRHRAATRTTSAMVNGRRRSSSRTVHHAGLPLPPCRSRIAGSTNGSRTVCPSSRCTSCMVGVA